MRRAVVLLYHRVAELEQDPQLLAVTPRHFSEHVEQLRKRAVPLAELAAQAAEGRVEHGAVAVTFDDGYADNLVAATPILEKHDVPATVFVTAGAVDSTSELWWDELERLVLEPLRLPASREGVELGPSATWTPEERARHRSWNVTWTSDPTPRHALYRNLHAKLSPLGAAERRHELNALRAWAGASIEGRASHRALSSSEVARLAASRLVEVGAHTVTHPRLSAIAPEEQRREIQESKARLEAIASRPIRGFAYPYGTRADYLPETVELVRESGFSYAASNFPDVVWRGSHRFELPRVLVRDLDGDVFARSLDAWLRG